MSSTLFQQPNGALVLALWQENANSTQATVNLGQQFGSINIIDPTQSATPVQTLTNASTATVTLGNAPLLLQLNNPSSALPTASGVKAISASAFLGSEGVNTHLSYPGPPYGNNQQTMQELAYLGVTNVRDQVPNSSDLSNYTQLAQIGVKFDLITSPQGEDLTATLPSDIDGAASLATAVPGSVATVEGPNELNGGQWVTLDGSSSQNASTGAQIIAAVSAAVTGNSTLTSQGVGVVNVSINNGNSTWQSYISGLGNLDQYVSAANWHVYFNNGAQPGSVISSMVQDALVSAPGKPVEITETGYETSGDSNSVSEQTQAQQTLKIFLDAYKQGVSKTYLYELANQGASGDGDSEDNYGLFNQNGSPKPVATAIQNMNTVLMGGSDNLTQDQSNGCSITADTSTGVNQNNNQINLSTITSAAKALTTPTTPLIPQTSLAGIQAPLGQ